MPQIVIDANLFVAAGFNPDSHSARILGAVRAGTLRPVWDEPTRRETEFVVGTIPPLRGTHLSAYFAPEAGLTGRPIPTDAHSSPTRPTASSPPSPPRPGRLW